MSPRLAACSSCARHVLVSATECPHCGTSIPTTGNRLLKTAGAAMLGLSMTACSGGEGDTGDGPQPAYGVVDTGDTGDQPEYGVPDTGEPQPDYGVPDTGEPQPDYGVPDTGVQPEYGVPDTGMYTDNDGDGYSEAEGDCDDDNASIHPGAEETPGDGIDSNCDGNDDT